MQKFKKLISLFFTMFKIGLFTFGGGYAMIGIIQRELVENKKWISQDEYLDIIAIAESTPGPIAINTSTFVGYKIAGFLGSIFATIATVLPSFIIIFIISLFFDAFMQLKVVEYAFRGIQVCVAYLIFSAGFKMLKHVKKTAFNIITFVISFSIITVFSVCAFSFSSVYYVLTGGGVGIIVYLISLISSKKSGKFKKGDK